MMRIIVVIFTFLFLLMLSLVTITKPLFSMYEEYILKGSYIGETYAALYFDFILYFVSPLCLIFSVLIVSYIYRRKNIKSTAK